MTGRKVVLLMDNFSGHELGVELVTAAQELQNTIVIWLPSNTTSLFQPLAQGIIYTWKAHYRKYWLQFLLDEVESGRDPVRTMNVLKAIRWGSLAWDLKVKPQTIQNCFTKSTLLIRITQTAQPAQLAQLEQLDPDQSENVDEVLCDVQQQMDRLQQTHYIRSMMDIQTFLNPEEEAVRDTESEIDERILAQFEPEVEAESDEEVEEEPQISVNEALEAVTKLQKYEEQSEKGDAEWTSKLNRYAYLLQTRKAQGQQQQDIRNYFTT